MTPPRDIVDSLEECRQTEKEFQFLVELGNAWPQLRDRLRAAEAALYSICQMGGPCSNPDDTGDHCVICTAEAWRAAKEGK